MSADDQQLGVRRRDDGGANGSFHSATVAVANGNRAEEAQHFLPKKLDVELGSSPAGGAGTAEPLLQQQQPRGGLAGLTHRVFFFVVLVAQSTGNQAFYKLSQRNGSYDYNTLSAMVVVEGVKLALCLGQLAAEQRFNFRSILTTFKRVEKRVYAAYIFLAVSYAAYNQLIFHVMELADPGTFALFKSLAPAIVAFLNLVTFGRRLTQVQVLCILVQLFGIVPVATSTNETTGKIDFTYGAEAVILMASTVTFAAFNTVYNASVVKKESANYPMNVQNSILYSAGCLINLMSYWVNKQPEDNDFFYGYGNLSVVVLLFFHGTCGITISMVYKYGDAVLKTLSQPMVSSILVFFSYFAFDAPLDVIKLAGAGTVITSTVLYLKLPAAAE